MLEELQQIHSDRKSVYSKFIDSLFKHLLQIKDLIKTNNMSSAYLTC